MSSSHEKRTLTGGESSRPPPSLIQTYLVCAVFSSRAPVENKYRLSLRESSVKCIFRGEKGGIEKPLDPQSTLNRFLDELADVLTLAGDNASDAHLGPPQLFHFAE
ncbi:hypothetical protein Poly21_14730 [Allorhodopirellula heiligendammensis]|uniref:Uncharacterized protein n=1 Tax=Allorhodopirellula heiligendammensis TaxID=2714739 RepID=A0A5C6C722_9BACT|nr:hypothetical protein Poly21_14730 [Allorhodopirellula heiligendammensis]